MSLGWAALAPLEVREKGALGTWSGVSQSGMGCRCPLLPGLQGSWGPLGCKRCLPVGEEEEERKGPGILQGGRVLPEFLLRMTKMFQIRLW